jgi:hypothetical protein
MTTEQLSQVEEIAALQFSKQETAVICECPVSDLSPAKQGGKAWLRGRLKAQAEVRKAMLQMAKQGSTPAQKDFQSLAIRSEEHED